ncbi:MAG: thioredoxin domain-containing protein [Acidobacteria bacterium]|nr:thioredoxin domain-containing protein [Acidobacteriota bacterium]
MSKEQYTNRLIAETSPYLLQHAHNPVDWYPWGEEAFRRAREEDKPIFLSIGYSACHWCHVMEHESFESSEIAQILNEHFVSVKVDREERPDVDAIYMNFVQMTTGSGGWPMSVFLTPEGVPFFGGTYFPPSDYYGRPGFRRVLESIAHYYEHRREELLRSNDEIVRQLQRLSEIPSSRIPLSLDLLDNAADGFQERFDPTHGGFGNAPKFPPSMTLMFLLRYHLRKPASRALHMVEHTLQKMAAGGICDQIGGGFHRYSVDAQWLVPHFEKMLYDNALLVRVYLEAYQLTHRACYRRIVEETLGYVLREMTHPQGGFYSAQDADSEGEEGKFFVWEADEIEEILGKEISPLFTRSYGVSSSGNFEGKNILHVVTPLEKLARQFGFAEADAAKMLHAARQKLFYEREKRIHPQTDTKVLTAWNGLMLTSFAQAYNVLRTPEYLSAAQKNAAFLLENLQRDGRMLRTWRDGQAKLNGYLEDYANLIEGLIALYEASFEEKWANEAARLANLMIEEFWDTQDGGFFFTGASHEKLVIRHKDFYDNATPSGNSMAAAALLKLWHLTGDRRFREYGSQVLERAAQMLKQLPVVFGYQLCALDFSLGPVSEIALIASPANQEKFLSVLRHHFLPRKVVAAKPPAQPAGLALLENRDVADNHSACYVCKDFVCHQPVYTPEELSEKLDSLAS